MGAREWAKAGGRLHLENQFDRYSEKRSTRRAISLV
jgi:hypothetical protein